jgi:hypothetical protein
MARRWRRAAVRFAVSGRAPLSRYARETFCSRTLPVNTQFLLNLTSSSP